MNSLVRATLILSTLSFFVATAQESAYKYELNKPYTYLMEAKSTVQQEAGGRKVNVSAESNAAFYLTILERTATGGMKAKIEVQSAVVIVERPDGMKTFGQDLAGKSFFFTMDNLGTVEENDSSIDAYDESSQRMLNRMMRFIPYLPAEKAEEGESWSREREYTLGTDTAPINVKQESEYEIEETVDVNGIKCLKILRSSESNYEGTVTQGNQELSLIGEAEIDGFTYYSKEQGIIVKIELNDKDESVIVSLANPSQQMTMTTSTSTTFELVSE